MANLEPLSHQGAPSEATAQRVRDSGRALSLSYGHNSYSADQGPVLVAMCPEAGRLVVVYSPLERSENSNAPYRVDEETGEILTDPEFEHWKFLENRRRAVRRSRSRLQDYVVANRLSKMWTLTVAHQEWGRDRAAFLKEVQRFMVKWEKLEGKKFPYAYVLELQARGMWHAHILVPNEFYTDFRRLTKLWGHGRVRFDRSKSFFDGSKRACRRAAVYLSKYLSKGWDETVPAGQHRYEVAEGFQPDRVSFRLESFKEARRFVGQIGGYRLMFASEEVGDWNGPPVEVYFNDDDVGVVAA